MWSGGGGDGPPPDDGSGGGRGDGDNYGRVMDQEERYQVKGEALMEILYAIIPDEIMDDFVVNMLDNPVLEMRALLTLRGILDSPNCPYKASFDLTTKKVVKKREPSVPKLKTSVSPAKGSKAITAKKRYVSPYSKKETEK